MSTTEKRIVTLRYSRRRRLAWGGGVAKEDEDIKTVEYSPEELDHALASGEIRDAKTIIGIQWWQTRFKHSERVG
jgi:hypothetical protein